MVKIHQHIKFQANPSMHSPANAWKPLRTDGQTDGRTDGHAVKWLRLVGWTNGPMYRSKDGISGFGRTDGRTDGQPENIMPPAPKGGGIKTNRPKLAITLALLAFVTPINTLRPRRSERHLADDIWSAFSWMKMFEFRLEFHWSLFVRVKLTIFQLWFR